MNLSSVLKASKGIPVDDFFALMWGQKIALQYETAEISGALPLSFRANGSDLRQYQIYGSTGGVGDKTVQLFEIESDMLSFLNWSDNPRLNNIVYFINYKLSDAVSQELKKGIHTCSIFEHFTDGYTPNLLVCAFAPTLENTVTEQYRILTNNGVTFDRTFNFSEWQDIYLIIGYGNGFRSTAEKQFKINELFKNWGISIVEGTTPPVSFVPFGYEVDMVSRTRNLLPFNDKNFIINNNYSNLIVKCENGNLYMKGTATEIISTNMGWKNNLTFELEAGEYFCNTPSPLGTGFGRYIKKYDNDSNLIASTNNTFTLTERTKCYLAFYIYNKTIDNKIELMLNLGSTALPYEPYSNATTPIYIGDEPLEKDEYVDYGEQKIYRMINGTLTPTDPPVPLPTLPTCDGTTVIDYAGESVAPSEMYIKYKKR